MHATCIRAGVPTHYTSLSFVTRVSFLESAYPAGRAVMLGLELLPSVYYE